MWISLQIPHAQVCLLPEAAPEVFLVSLAVRETRAWRLCAADTAAVQAPVHFRLMKAKHLRAKQDLNNNISSFHQFASCVDCSTPLQPYIRGSDQSGYFIAAFQINLIKIEVLWTS